VTGLNSAQLIRCTETSSMTSEYFHPAVHPTVLPDGTELLGVIYDAGGRDLLLYRDVLLSIPGSLRDAWAQSPPYGLDVAHGRVLGGIPALGPIKRPEAQRLEKILAVSRPELVTQSRSASNKNGQIASVPLSQIKQVLFYSPRFGISWICFNILTDNGSDNWSAFDVSMYDRSYVIALFGLWSPGKWVRLTRQEWREFAAKNSSISVVLKNSKHSAIGFVVGVGILLLAIFTQHYHPVLEHTLIFVGFTIAALSLVGHGVRGWFHASAKRGRLRREERKKARG
jgi:hypothetical protein